jgi:bla regulator protein blaR1
MLRRIAIASLVFSSLVASGQPEFEAVSIKPNKSGDVRAIFHPSPGGRLNATNVTAKALIEWAYGIRDFQLSGEPGWADSERFDVAAKSDGNPRYDFIKPELETMFRVVLADRFKLAVHRTTKEMPIYSLVLAKNGAKIQAVDEGDCPEVPTPENPCRSLRSNNFGQLTAKKAPLPALALVLVGYTRRVVVDNTGLKGSYSYTLDWTKYLQPPELPPGVVPPPNAFDPASMEPAIAAALEEQLGLKLEPGKGPVEMIVVDHLERPSEN